MTFSFSHWALAVGLFPIPFIPVKDFFPDFWFWIPEFFETLNLKFEIGGCR